jgi:hypothetical protein
MSKKKLIIKEKAMVKFWYEQKRPVKWILERYDINEVQLQHILQADLGLNLEIMEDL